METPLFASNSGTVAPRPGILIEESVVEIALLLPADRFQALVDLSRRRGQTVGQILRRMIDRALAGEVD